MSRRLAYSIQNDIVKYNCKTNQMGINKDIVQYCLFGSTKQRENNVMACYGMVFNATFNNF